MDRLPPQSLSADRRVQDVDFRYEDSDEEDDMALLEDTYQQSRIQAGPEVEEFGQWLDDSNLTDATAAAYPDRKRERILRLVDRYHEYAHSKAAVLRERRQLEKQARGRRWDSSDDANDMDVDATQADGEADEATKWESESQTWGLLARLLPLRHKDPSAPPPRPNPAPETRRDFWDEFVLSDSVAQERKAVLEWLQSTACAGPEINDLVHEFQHKANRGDLVAHGWLHTREAIKLHKSVNAIPGVLEPNANMTGFSYITQLDPDAITRQGRKLEDSDEYFERAIWLGCYHLLRRGSRMDDIRDWCTERNEIWRAATISALPLSTLGDDDLPDFDPSAFVLWRRMCYALVKSGGTDDWERAVYGILSGDIDSILSVCQTWDDFMFAHYNALLRTQFDSYLIKYCRPEAALPHGLPAFDAVQYLGEGTNVAKKLVEQIESDGTYFQLAHKEANTAAKALQGAIIANTLDSYIYQQGLALSTEANQDGKSFLIPDLNLGPSQGNLSRYTKMSEHDGLRVITHIVIMINALESTAASQRGPDGIRTTVGEHAIAAYVSFLRLAQMELLIPLYCAQLSKSRRYETLSLNLIHVRDRDEQMALLNQIRRAGMDIGTFLKEQPQHFLNQLEESKDYPAKDQFKILHRSQPDIIYGRGITPDFMGLDGRNEMVHENLIRAMEWLFAGEGNLLVACDFGAKIYKHFLKHKYLDAARDFCERVKVEDLIAVLANREVADTEEFVTELRTNEHALYGEIDSDEENHDTSQKRIATAVKNMWELQSFVVALDSIESVGTLAKLVGEPSAKNVPAREFFENLGMAIRKAKNGMKPLLHGWLLETNEDEQAQEFAQLRETYLPETVIAYVAALQYAGNWLTRENLLEAMDLAATIAGKDSDVAELFVQTGRIKELVAAFASCSKALAAKEAAESGGGGSKKRVGKAGQGTSAKKMKELGWQKDLWNVTGSS